MVTNIFLSISAHVKLSLFDVVHQTPNIYVIVISWESRNVAVNEPRPEGVARGGGLFTSHKRSNYGSYILLVVLETRLIRKYMYIIAKGAL